MPTNPTVEEILAQARLLSLEERALLLEKLRADLLEQTTNLLQRVEGSQIRVVKEDSESRYSIMDFEGVARGTWDEVGGVDKFLKQERASWDG